MKAVLTGGVTKASKLFHDFDWIYHRLLPANCEIQNGKILRTRTGDKFKYDLFITVKIPDTPVIQPDRLKGTIGINIGFRQSGNTILVASIMSDDASAAPLDFKASSSMF